MKKLKFNPLTSLFGYFYLLFFLSLSTAIACAVMNEFMGFAGFMVASSCCLVVIYLSNRLEKRQSKDISISITGSQLTIEVYLLLKLLAEQQQQRNDNHLIKSKDEPDRSKV